VQAGRYAPVVRVACFGRGEVRTKIDERVAVTVRASVRARRELEHAALRGLKEPPTIAQATRYFHGARADITSSKDRGEPTEGDHDRLLELEFLDHLRERRAEGADLSHDCYLFTNAELSAATSKTPKECFSRSL
jgi:hypothetical protein